MQNEDKIIELLAEQLIRQDQLIQEMREMKGGIRDLQEQQAKTNLAIGELRLSVTKLADEIKVVHDLEHRVSAIEVQLRASR